MNQCQRNTAAHILSIYTLLSFVLRDGITWNKRKSCRVLLFPCDLTQSLLSVNYSYLRKLTFMPIRLVFKQANLPALKNYIPQSRWTFVPYWISLSLSLFATKARLPRENISALNYIIWLLVRYTRFPSVINSSIEKGRTFSPLVSRINDIIILPILGDCDFRFIVSLKKLMFLFTSTEQVGRRGKGCNNWEKSLYSFKL